MGRAAAVLGRRGADGVAWGASCCLMPLDRYYAKVYRHLWRWASGGSRVARAGRHPRGLRARARRAAASRLLAATGVPVGLAFAALAARADVRPLRRAGRTSARLGRPPFSVVVPAASSRRWPWVVLVACIIPWVDAYSVWRGRRRRSSHTTNTSSVCSRSRSRSRVSTPPPTWVSPTCCSSRSSSARPTRLGYASTGRG